MQLLVEELGLYLSTLRQKITIGSHDMNVVAIRPHLYKHLNPAGSLTITIQDTSDVTIATSSAVTVQSITDASGNYFHGNIKFDVKAHLKKNTSYYVKLSSSAYTFDEAAWIGWCLDYDLQIVDRDYTVEGPVHTPFLFEIWSIKEIEKGRSF